MGHSDNAQPIDTDLGSATAGGTFLSRLLESVEENAERIALRRRRDDGTYATWTYRQYADEVARCAAGLRALGFGPGQRLVMMLRNRPEFHVLDVAAMFCGGTPVSIYNSSSPEQIEYLVNHCEATIAVADDPVFLERFLAIRDRLPTLAHVGVLGSEVPSAAFGWDALLAHAPIDLTNAARAVEPGDLATLIYTSGTTGPSKAVMLTHQNIMSTISSVEQLFADDPRLSQPAGLRVVSYLPMAHIGERNNTHYFGLARGYELTCCPEPTQLAMYLREVRPQTMFGVPRVWEKLYFGIQAAVAGDVQRANKLKEAVETALPIALKLDAGSASPQEKRIYESLDEALFRNLRALIGLDEVLFAVTGAAPMAREMQLWFRAIGLPLCEGYGMSECGVMTLSPPKTAKTGSVGKTLPGLEIKLAEDGEILCRGPLVFRGYYKSPDKTAEALDDEGWLHSGDIGQIDEEGYFRIVDRKKELIITSGGKNISPANLEIALKGLPLVAQACAIGEQRPFVSALLVLDPDAAKVWAARHGLPRATLAELAQHPALIAEIESDLPRVMASFNNAEKVKRVTILSHDWLPDSDVLTPTAKLKRRAICAKYGAEIEQMYATTLAPPSAAASDTKAKRKLG